MAEEAQDFIVSDELKADLQRKLHELEFIDSPFKLKGSWCCNCKNVAIKHRIAGCLDVFCESCFNQLYNQSCPLCKTTITESTQDEEFEKTVFRLKVVCEFKKNGCQEIVHLGYYLTHLSRCRFSIKNLLPKVYKGDPRIEVVEQFNADLLDIKKLLQQVLAENQQLKETLEAKTIKHEAEMAVLQKAIDDRFDETLSELKRLRSALSTDSESAACKTVTVIEKMLRELDQMKVQNKNSFAEIEAKVSKENDSLDYENEDVSSELRHTTFNWKISNVQLNEEPRDGWLLTSLFTGLVTGNRDVFESEEFIIPGHGLKFKAKLTKPKSSNHLTISLQFTINPSAKSSAFLHSRKYVLVNQSEDYERKHAVLLDQPYFGQNSAREMTRSTFGCTKFFPINLLHDSDEFMKNNTIVIRIILEPIFQMFRNIASTDGILLWRIDNYSKLKQEELVGFRSFLNSKSFYTSNTGYRLDAQLYLNGDYDKYGKHNTGHIAVRAFFRIGQWDTLHSGPFKYKCKCCLLDQSDAPSKNDIVQESKICSYDPGNPGLGFSNFVTHEDAEKLPYLKDDVLLIKFVVEIL